MLGIFFCNSHSYFIKNITKSEFLVALFPMGFQLFLGVRLICATLLGLMKAN
jgi:hypothetical protein